MSWSLEALNGRFLVVLLANPVSVDYLCLSLTMSSWGVPKSLRRLCKPTTTATSVTVLSHLPYR